MWGVTLWKKVFVENKRKDLSEFCKISNARCSLAFATSDFFLCIINLIIVSVRKAYQINAAWEREVASKENEMAILR